LAFSNSGSAVESLVLQLAAVFSFKQSFYKVSTVCLWI